MTPHQSNPFFDGLFTIQPSWPAMTPHQSNPHATLVPWYHRRDQQFWPACPLVLLSPFTILVLAHQRLRHWWQVRRLLHLTPIVMLLTR